MNGIRFGKCQHLAEGSRTDVAGVIDVYDPALGKSRTSACRKCYDEHRRLTAEPSSAIDRGTRLHREMLEREFFELPCGRYPAQRGIYLPLRGPWIITSQHDFTFQRRYREKLPWKEAQFCASGEGKIFDTLHLSIGDVAYQRSVDGGMEIAAYWYDTSD